MQEENSDYNFMLSSSSSSSSSSSYYDGQKKLFLPNNKREHYYKVRYDWEFSQFLNSSKVELNTIHDVYPKDYVERDVSLQDKMWRSVIHLQSVMFQEDWSDYRRKKMLRDLYDTFDELSSKRFISRPNFECCLLKVCRGYRHRSKDDEKFNMAMDNVYNSFDVHSQEAFDWRRFLYCMYILLEPNKTPKEHLLSAFAKIVGWNNKSCSIDLQELGMVLYPLVKASAMEDVLYAMDEAWAQVKAMYQNLFDDGKIESTKLTINIFEQMLEMQAMQHFFDQSESSWGKGKIFPVYISRWEQELYNKTLIDLVRTTKRDESISDKLKRDRYRTKLHVWRLWLDEAKYQGTLCSVLTNINRRMALHKKSRGLYALSHWRTMWNAARDIQSVARGFFGRNVARHCCMIYNSSTMIQTQYRMRLARKVLYALWSRYISAIVTVQSAIRGALARRLVFKKLMTLVEQEHLRNVKERERFEWERGIWCLTKLQGYRRRQLAISTANQLRQKLQREIQIQRAMETERKRFLRERQIYERQLEQHYRSMKEEHDSGKQIQAKVDQDKVKVNTLRRRLLHDELKAAEPDLELEEYLVTEKWKSEWEARMESGVKDIKRHSIHCLDQPDNSVEKQTRKTTRKRIKGRVKEVLRRADEQGIPMETKEGREIAREEIIHIIGEEERLRLRDEMDKAFTEREKEKEEERIRTEARQQEAHKRATVYAVSVVSKACRKWLARKELRRLCLETYEKIFDETHHMFYYRHRITGESSWTKPKAMGDFEMPAKNEWKLLRDSHNFPYYFNPLVLEMRWTPPPLALGQDMCCGIVPHYWWREYPIRKGQCPNFSCLLNEDDGKRYCQECYCEQLGNCEQGG